MATQRREKRKRTASINIRTFDKVKELAEDLAKDDGRPLANYLERLIIEKAIEAGKIPDARDVYGDD